MADGDSLRQPFFAFPGLTFLRVRGIVWYLFGSSRVARGAAGGLLRDRRYFVFAGLFDFLTAFRIYTHGKRGIRVRV